MVAGGCVPEFLDSVEGACAVQVILRAVLLHEKGGAIRRRLRKEAPQGMHA